MWCNPDTTHYYHQTRLKYAAVSLSFVVSHFLGESCTYTSKEPCCAAAMTDISVFQVLLSHTEYILGPVYPYTHNFCAIYRRVGCSRRVCDVRCPVREFLLTFFLSCLNTLLNSLLRGLGSLLCFQDVNKKKSFLGNGKKNDCPSVLLHQLQLENCYFHNNSTHSRS